jgi:hypothetical protein
MKPLPRSKNVSVFLRGVRIYRDDVERMLTSMHEAGLTIKITDDTFEYDSLDELQKARGSSPRHLNIESSSRSEQISVSMSDRCWHVSSYSEQNYELARSMEAILKARQTRLERMPIMSMTVIGGSLAYLTTGADTNPAWIKTTVLGVALVLTLCAGIMWLYIHFRTGVILNYRHQAGFFARNRDKIIVSVCTALFLAALQIIIWLLTGHSVQLFGP